MIWVRWEVISFVITRYTFFTYFRNVFIFTQRMCKPPKGSLQNKLCNLFKHVCVIYLNIFKWCLFFGLIDFNQS